MEEKGKGNDRAVELNQRHDTGPLSVETTLPPKAIAVPAFKVHLLETIAEAWNEANLTYAIVHGIDDYPARAGRDLDVFAHERNAHKLIKTARIILRDAGFSIFTPPKLWGERVLACHNLEWQSGMEIHTMESLSWRNVLLVESIAPSEYMGPFKIDPWASFVKRVLLPLLAKGASKAFSEKISQLGLTPSEASSARSNLAQWLSKGHSSTLLNALAKKDLYALDQLIPELRKKFSSHAWKKSFLGSIRWNAGKVKRRLLQLVSPCVPVVALVGPDGVGKSSVIHEIKSGDPSFFVDIDLRHWRPSVLPALGKIGGSISERRCQPPRRQPGKLKWFRLLYYATDYILGFYLRDRPAASRQKLVIYDRCALDMFVDPTRYGLSSNAGLLTLWKLLPGPDLVILLSDSPPRIHARKAELSLSELSSQLESWRKLTSSNLVHACIPVDAPANQIADRIRKEIMAKIFSSPAS